MQMIEMTVAYLAILFLIGFVTNEAQEHYPMGDSSDSLCKFLFIIEY